MHFRGLELLFSQWKVYLLATTSPATLLSLGDHIVLVFTPQHLMPVAAGLKQQKFNDCVTI
jgi:hypothetical protein